MALAHLHHIPAGRPFAEDLARGILAMVDDPKDMSDSIILLPNRRLSKSLKTAFLRLAEGKAQLLPRMMPIGDIDEDAAELIAAGWDASDKPPIIDSLDRQLLLSRLVKQFLHGTDLASLSEAEVIALARALGSFLDQMQTAGCDPEDLADLTNGDHAGHWQRILSFLNIVVMRWPDVLNEQALSDPVVWRNAAIEARAKAWQEQPPKGLVIIAGSTGSQPSTQVLMRSVLKLSRGHVVLPALDTEMPEQDWQDLQEESSQEGFDPSLVSHPQFPLANLLKILEIDRQDIALWHGVPKGRDDYDAEKTGRLALLREAMRPAKQAGQWRLIPERQQIKHQALDGLKRVDCYDRKEEAFVIALAMREALETPGKTAMLISGDQRLSQMVSGALKQWGISVSSSAGQSLDQTPVAHFLQLIIDAWQSDFATIPLLAMARHRLAAAGMDKTEFRHKIRLLERHVLRGPKIKGGLKALAEKAHEENQDLGQFVHDHLIRPLTPLVALEGRINLTLADFADAHGQAAEMMGATPVDQLEPWRGQDGVRLGKFMHRLGLYGRKIPMKAASYPAVLKTLMSAEVIYPDHVDHPRLSILGTVEARMQSADLTILGGMNEGIAPPEVPVDPWMSNAMRVEFGLPHAHWRNGHAAHDAVMAMARPEVLITLAGRDKGTPTEASRWLRRIDAVLSVAQQTWPRADYYKDYAAGLMPDIGNISPCPRPAPKPPVDLRPTQFSATQIDTLLRDPYAVYAKRILHLAALPALDEVLGAADWGNVNHKALAEYLNNYPQGLSKDEAYQAIIKVGKEAFLPYQDNPQVPIFWWPRFEQIARYIADLDGDKKGQFKQRFGEIKGQITIDIDGKSHRLSAQADRIDLTIDGKINIIDYKTGTPASKTQVENGRALQLLVETLIAAEGAFPDVDKDIEISSLQYWKLSGRRDAPGKVNDVTPKDDDFINNVRDGIEGLLRRFQNPDQAYAAEPVEKEANPYSDYRHLARVAEWRVTATDGGED